MKTAVIAPLGLSPPVITSFIEGFKRKIDHLIILTTTNERVKNGLELIKTALHIKYPHIRIHEIELPYDDINTTEQNLDFMARCSKVIYQQRNLHNCDEIYLNIAGGRKNMCITLALIGQLLAVDGVYHIVTRDVKIVNVELERLKNEIGKLASLSNLKDKVDFYNEHEAEFNNLLFPPSTEYELIRIPTLPYPQDFLSKLFTIIESADKQDIDLDLVNLSDESKQLLLKHDILEKSGKKYKLSDYGRNLIKALLNR